jgi:integrase
MASVHKRKESKFWWGSFYHEGKQVFRSTGQTDQAKALQVVLAWEEAVKGHVETQEQARKVMADLLSKILGTGKGRMGCGDFHARWLAAMKGTVSPKTVDFYKGAAGAFVKHVGEKRSLDAVSKEDVVAWRTAEMERVQAKTVNNRLKAVRAMFNEAIREGFVIENPAAGLKVVKVKRTNRVRRPFTKPELAKVLAKADPVWKLMTLLGLQTGQRLGDIARMEWHSLNTGEKVWQFVSGKTDRPMRVPLSDQVVQLLSKRKKGKGKSPTGPVFPELVAQIERSHGAIGGASKQFAHLLWLAKLRAHTPYGQGKKTGEDDRREQHELSFHSLRHTARTWLEEAGQPKAVIDALIGHEGDTGKIYTTVGEDALRSAAAALAAAGNST